MTYEFRGDGEIEQEIHIANENLTERHLTEEADEALPLSEDRLRLALESANIGTWDFRPLIGQLIWDARCKELFGLPPDAEVTYDTFLAGLHPDDRQRTDAIVQRSFDPASGGRYDIEYRTVGIQNKIERWIAANGQAFFDRAGRAVRFIGTVLDITERKRAEAARAQQLEQERHLRAQAEEASRLKDEFLATISHELRTPLTGFLGYAQILQRRTRNDPYISRAIEKMVQSAQNQARLIEDLLDISRIVSGKLRIEVQPIDLNTIIRLALDTVRPAVDAKNHTVHLQLNSEGNTIIGDANRLQQVVWNLLSNAAKFTPPGGDIYVSLEPHGREAQLVVRDTGQGISAAFLPYVFDHFRQADSTSNRVHGGLGIGLAIVRYLVELHGGTVEAASDGEGSGATFTIRLPRIPEDQAILVRARSAKGEPGINEQCLAELDGLRVLVVDDRLDILEILHEILAPCGTIIRMCDTARDALEVVRAWKPDVLVSDIAMPKEDGYWLIRRIRALTPEEGGLIPAVALTAYAHTEERQRVMASGFQHYLSKPVEQQELRTIVAQLAKMIATG